MSAMPPSILVLVALGALCVLAVDWLSRRRKPGILDVPPPPPPGLSVTPPPPGPDFVGAVRAVDVAVAYLVETEQYGPAQQQAARVLRAAVVEGATPPVPPGVEAPA